VAAVQHTFTHKQHTEYRERYIHNNKKKKIGKCGQCPVFASYALAFALQQRNEYGKPPVMVIEKVPRYSHPPWAIHIYGANVVFESIYSEFLYRLPYPGNDGISPNVCRSYEFWATCFPVLAMRLVIPTVIFLNFQSISSAKS
jgi:hypothetical protein